LESAEPEWNTNSIDMNMTNKTVETIRNNFARDFGGIEAGTAA
jgi:hypothetical protein